MQEKNDVQKKKPFKRVDGIWKSVEERNLRHAGFARAD